MSTLPVAIDLFDDTICLYTTEQEAAWDVVQSVAAVVPPTVLANVARAVHEFNESAGLSAAAAVDNACADIESDTPIRVLRLDAYEALALSAALNRVAIELLQNEATA